MARPLSADLCHSHAKSYYASHTNALRSQKTVTVHLISKHILPLDFAR